MCWGCSTGKPPPAPRPAPQPRPVQGQQLNSFGGLASTVSPTPIGRGNPGNRTKWDGTARQFPDPTSQEAIAYNTRCETVGHAEVPSLERRTFLAVPLSALRPQRVAAEHGRLLRLRPVRPDASMHWLLPVRRDRVRVMSAQHPRARLHQLRVERRQEVRHGDHDGDGCSRRLFRAERQIGQGV
jgi:hypothetical protein